ncbi:MAG TPA: nuclear transport factor 2 family protein [Pyrinomonadaceae bacterium]
MNSILAVALLIAILSLCNLTDKSKPTADSNSNTNSTETTKPVNDNGHPDQSRSDSSSSPTASNAGTDHAALTVDLMKIEYDVTTASFAGDISTLASFVADDYSGTGADGRTQNKNQLLASTKPDKITKSWKITEGQLVSSNEDSAVLTYIQTQTLRDGRTGRARVTDTFVKRNGRWLVESEQQTLIR